MEDFEKKIIAANRLQADLLQKAMNGENLDSICKGKAAAMGEIRDWKGQKYQKTPNGWRPVKKGSGSESGQDEKEIPKETKINSTDKEALNAWTKRYSETTDPQQKEVAAKWIEHLGGEIPKGIDEEVVGKKDSENQDKNQKSHFELTSETKVNGSGVTLHRVKLSVDSKWGKKGALGGWVEKPENISGDAWVSGDAEVFGNAKVSGNAKVFGNAKVSGNAWVFGNAKVYDNAKVSGDVEVPGDAEVFGNAWVSW